VAIAAVVRRHSVFLAAIGLAWLLSVYAEVTGLALRLHHHSLYHGGLPFWQAALVLLAAWQVMTAAMMLPSSLPMIRHFEAVSRRQARPALAVTLFVIAYFTVWSGFAVLAWSGDYMVHTGVHDWSWLAAHEQLIAAGVLATAAVYQFSPLKDACLRECRHPAAFLMRFYRSGLAPAFNIGLKHGLFCLGCCWALMLVMFAAGVAHLYWMAVLGFLMLAEKAFPHGDRLTAPIGVTFAALAALALLVPSSVPGL
jgi:predicted metal-binding membrane protein